MKKFICLSFLTFISGVASAQETHASFNFLGFSSDLKYAAMETYAEGQKITDKKSKINNHQSKRRLAG